ncbi:hypothetical protein CHLNCDRAFT_136384 [Chlorella variabilis]|uniref:Uncharacterized protein n=1 Tax=Chlorella variabilis TaxID=554065 RepID=E1ZK93_CHLVA|nr:hypothetical protein CHLNCDRAFT_136384 [Chlorella variabilis]EFN53654.1 hypothetical protein CHLNCDRAFT_136384 [Chlorella variabilis]|eukprot:XP_005845756.1 hypothetical protein CHLNCDRAFT_136384 [Chlorella variabilis]
MEGDSPGLETAACAALLQERFSLVAERHAEDLHHAEAQLRGALKDLELVKQQSERELERRAGQLRREYAAAMAALERRFLTDAEALQASRGGARSWR